MKIIIFVGILLTAWNALSSDQTCQFWEDPQGIPHMRATTEMDGFACMGYLHGRNRIWQMDYFRKTMQGRKAEFYGKDSIQSDFVLRLLGLQEKAQSLYAEMNDDQKKIFIVYTKGVNQGMKEALKQGVYEFKQLGYSPDAWTPQDTLGLILLQSFDQSKRAFQTHIDQGGWAKAYPKDAPELFEVHGTPWDTTILKKGEYPQKEQRPSDYAQQNSTEVAGLFPDVFGGVGSGSNNWVIGPKRSATGNAWLANDPHLQLASPPFWYWLHIEAGSIDAIGASFPGVPMIVSGTNRHVSWGLTNAFLPVAQVSWVDEKELADASSTRPLIWFQFWKFKLPFFFKSFRRTVTQLPVLPVPGPSGKAMVLRWSGFDLHPSDLTPLYDVLRSKSSREVDLSLSQMGVPTWNFIFADDQGNIGYRSVGRVARFAQRPAFGISTQKLSTLSEPFDHPLTAEEMPHILNPPRGYIATANNPQWPIDSQWSVGYGPYASFRAFRIEELIQAKKLHNLESIQQTQCDVQAVDARFLLPKLLAALSSQAKAGKEKVIELLKSWNFETHLSCRACGLYRLWFQRVASTQNLNSTALFRKLSAPSSVLDESLRKAVAEGFSYALEQLKWNEKKELPMWGEVHLNYFQHIGGAQFSSTVPLSNPGDDNTVNLATNRWNGQSWNVQEGASHRLIVEMSRPPQVYSVLAGANADLETRDLQDPKQEWQKWVKCQQQKRLFPLDWSKVQGARFIQID